MQAIRKAANAWVEPDYGPRAEAAAKTLGAPNTFTEEAVAFAVNQLMDRLRSDASTSERGDSGGVLRGVVGVVNRGETPLDDLSGLLAVLGAGYRYLGTRAEASPFLLPAFVEEIRRYDPDFPAAFVADEEALFERAGAVIARGDEDERMRLAALAERCGLPSERLLLLPDRFGVAVLDGRESEDELEHLAEDVLLHEGRGAASVALVCAPQGLSPDALLDAFAAFRGVFPAHPSTPGRLKMQQAFLKAAGQPHAYGEGLEFLMSRGPAEVQQPGHVRWVEYDDRGQVEAWLGEHSGEIELVVARPHLAGRLRSPYVPLAPGHAHRQPPGASPSTEQMRAFLSGL